MGQQVNVNIGIPKDLPESMFPLVFNIEAEKLSITPYISSEWPDENLPVESGKTLVPNKTYPSFHYKRTLSYEEYTGTGSAAERYAAVMDMKDPVAVLTAKTAYDNAVQAGDWDAVDTLLDVVQSGKGKLSKEGMDYLISKDSKINYYTYLTDHGVPTKRAKAFEADLKELYTSEKRTDAKATDMIRVAGSGKYSNKEADAIMQYEREVSDERRERYQDQLAWNLEQAGKSGLYTEAWSKIESVELGEMDNATFKKWVDQNVPIERRQAIKDIASNLSEDTHAAGKYVSAIYGAAREIGCSPAQALEFFQHIDSNFNNRYTKKEIRAAIKWAGFGGAENRKKVEAYLKERGIL